MLKSEPRNYSEIEIRFLLGKAHNILHNGYLFLGAIVIILMQREMRKIRKGALKSWAKNEQGIGRLNSWHNVKMPYHEKYSIRECKSDAFGYKRVNKQWKKKQLIKNMEHRLVRAEMPNCRGK